MTYYPTQIHNGLEILRAVHERARLQHWTRWQRRHMERITIQCSLTEANLHNYGNWGNSESIRLADPVPVALQPVVGYSKWVGSDHDSVGCFQQRVPSWGTTADCMDPKKSCHKFMNRATQVGVDIRNGVPNRLDIQRVQVSFDASGSNYAANYTRARWFVSHFRARLFIRRHRHRIAQEA